MKKRSYRFNDKRYTKYSIGGLWMNHEKMDPTHPDFMGELAVPPILLEDLVNQQQGNAQAKISIAAWRNTSKDGENYLTLTGRLPKAILKTCIRNK